MISLMSAIRRRPGLSHAAFVSYLRDVHGEISVRNPLQLAAYVQNHVTDSLAGRLVDPAYTGPAPDCDAVVELQFTDLGALFATIGDPYTREVIGPDGANFSDLSSALAVLVDETPVSVPTPGPGDVKVISFLYAASGVSPGDVADRWAKAHAAVPDAAFARVREMSHHRQLPEGAPILPYFGGHDVPVPDAVLRLRLDDPAEALAVAGDYLDAVAAIDPFLDLRKTLTVLADEVVLYERP